LILIVEDYPHGKASAPAMVAWGDEGAIRARVQQHLDAGADHVCIQPISPQGSPPGSRQIVDDRILELLAPARRS